MFLCYNFARPEKLLFMYILHSDFTFVNLWNIKYFYGDYVFFSYIFLLGVKIKFTGRKSTMH